MVINYKKLNDNTYDDAYKIPIKDSLINFIQGYKYFSPLDCKNRFWQITFQEHENIVYTLLSSSNCIRCKININLCHIYILTFVTI